MVAQLAGHVAGEQALPSHKPELPCCLLLRKPLTQHGIADLIGDAPPRFQPQNYDALVAQRDSADPDGRDRRRQRDCPGTLHIVIERACLSTILLKDAASIAGSEVLPMQQCVRKQPGHGFHVHVKERMVAFPADCGVDCRCMWDRPVDPDGRCRHRASRELRGSDRSRPPPYRLRVCR